MTQASFRDIFEAYYNPLCRFLNLYTKDSKLIEDIVQDVFCTLWQNHDITQIKHIQSYLYTASRNRMLNYIRNNKLHEAVLAAYLKEEQELITASDCVDKEEFDLRLQLAIANLSPKCRLIYQLSRDRKMSYKEIAQQEMISEKMVEKHISIALKKIKEYIGTR